MSVSHLQFLCKLSAHFPCLFLTFFFWCYCFLEFFVYFFKLIIFLLCSVKRSFPILLVAFYFVDCSLSEQQILILTWSHLFILVLTSFAFDDFSRKSVPTPMSCRVFETFSSRNVDGFWLQVQIFFFLFHLDLLFVYGETCGCCFSFPHAFSQLSQGHLLKRPSFFAYCFLISY